MLQGVALVLAVLELMGECSQTDIFDVLALLPLVSPSNHQYDEAVLMALARRGHRVTVYSQFPPDIPHPRYRHVPLDVYSQPDYDYFDRRWASWKKSDYITLRILHRQHFYKSVNYVKNSKQFRALRDNLESGRERYDVVVMERLSGQEHMLLFPLWANAPVVVLEPCGRNISTDIEHFFELPTYVLVLIYTLDPKSANNPFEHFPEKYNAYLKAPNIWLQSSYDSLLNWNMAYPILTYTNDMVVKSVTYPTVRVSGIHINPSPTPLPEKEQKFLDSADRGVLVFDIVMSKPELGRTRLLPYLHALMSLTQSLPGLHIYAGPPEEALLRIPQQVLEHRNCKLLITDGNLLRIQEAIYYGVPVLVVPQTSFQNYTAAYMKATEMSEVMDLVEFKNTSKLLDTVTEMLNNKRYQERADMLSRVFRSQMSGLECTVHQSLVQAISGYRSKTEATVPHNTPRAAPVPDFTCKIDASPHQPRDTLLDFLIYNCVILLNVFCVTKLFCFCSCILFIILVLICVYGIRSSIHIIRQFKGSDIMCLI